MIEGRVERILRESKATRNDDFLLYARYISKHHPKLKHVELVEAFKNHKTYDLPSYTTVIRARQKLQVKYPELKDENLRIK